MPPPKDPNNRDHWYSTHRGSGHPMHGRSHSEVSKKKMSEAKKGKTNKNKGMVRSQETIAKMSAALKGRTYSVETLERMANGQRGRKHSEEVRKKIAASHIGKKHEDKSKILMSLSKKGKKCGNENPNWRDGASKYPYCILWTDEFRERCKAFYGYVCIICGMTEEEHIKKYGRKLHVHHVNYDKMMCCNDVEPLFVSLCCSHNSKANFNREKWEDFFTNLIKEKYFGKCYFTREEMVVYWQHRLTNN